MDLIDRGETILRIRTDLCPSVNCDCCMFHTEDGDCKVEDWVDELPSAEPHKGSARDLIDRSELYKALGTNKNCDGCKQRAGTYLCGWELTRAEICDTIAGLLTVDAVEVVRCKDCMFSKVYQNDSSGVMGRFCEAFTQVRMVTDDDFCSYGERKTDHER